MQGVGSWIKGAQLAGTLHTADSAHSGQQPPAKTTRPAMAKEWGYASHNGESSTGPGALHCADRRPWEAPAAKATLEGRMGTLPSAQPPLPSSRQRFPLPGALSLPGGRLAPFPRLPTSRIRTSQVQLSSPSPGQAGTHPSAPCCAGIGWALTTTCSQSFSPRRQEMALSPLHHAA